MLLFMGAGASVPFGIPDTKGFIDRSYFSRTDRDLEDLLIKIKFGFNRDEFDIEILLTILNDLSKKQDELLDTIATHTSRMLINRFLLLRSEESKEFIGDKALKNVASRLFEEIKKRIRVTCFEQVNKSREKILKTYDDFFIALNIEKPIECGYSKDIKYPVVKIFTTNYDTCIETYLNARQVEFFKGSVEQYGELIFDVDQFISSPRNVELVKLHGSIDLFEKDRKIRFLPAPGVVDDKGRTYLGEEYGNEFIIYPVESSTSRDTWQSPMIELLNVLRNRLINENSWVIIGSTFRDLTLTSIMNDVLMRKKKTNYPKVIHINPSAEKVNKYLESKGYAVLAEVIEPISSTFLDESTIEVLKNYELR